MKKIIAYQYPQTDAECCLSMLNRISFQETTLNILLNQLPLPLLQTLTTETFNILGDLSPHETKLSRSIQRAITAAQNCQRNLPLLVDAMHFFQSLLTLNIALEDAPKQDSTQSAAEKIKKYPQKLAYWNKYLNCTPYVKKLPPELKELLAKQVLQNNTNTLDHRELLHWLHTTVIPNCKTALTEELNHLDFSSLPDEKRQALQQHLNDTIKYLDNNPQKNQYLLKAISIFSQHLETVTDQIVTLLEQWLYLLPQTDSNPYNARTMLDTLDQIQGHLFQIDHTVCTRTSSSDPLQTLTPVLPLLNKIKIALLHHFYPFWLKHNSQPIFNLLDEIKCMMLWCQHINTRTKDLSPMSQLNRTALIKQIIQDEKPELFELYFCTENPFDITVLLTKILTLDPSTERRDAPTFPDIPGFSEAIFANREDLPKTPAQISQLLRKLHRFLSLHIQQKETALLGPFSKASIPGILQRLVTHLPTYRLIKPTAEATYDNLRKKIGPHTKKSLAVKKYGSTGLALALTGSDLHYSLSHGYPSGLAATASKEIITFSRFLKIAQQLGIRDYNSTLLFKLFNIITSTGLHIGLASLAGAPPIIAIGHHVFNTTLLSIFQTTILRGLPTLFPSQQSRIKNLAPTIALISIPVAKYSSIWLFNHLILPSLLTPEVLLSNATLCHQHQIRCGQAMQAGFLARFKAQFKPPLSTENQALLKAIQNIPNASPKEMKRVYYAFVRKLSHGGYHDPWLTNCYGTWKAIFNKK